MTPLEKAQSLLEALQGMAAERGLKLPGPPVYQFAMIGTPVIDCAGVIVAVTAVDPQSALTREAGLTALPTYECGPLQNGTFSISINRDCAWTATEQGFTDPSAMAKLARELDDDVSLLWDFAVEYEEWATKTWNMRMARTGGLAITSLLLTTAID